LERQVLKNLAEFQAFELCAECLDRASWRDAAVVELAAGKPDRETADLVIRSIADRDKTLTDALTLDWDTGRPPDAAAKSELVFGLQPKDQLLLQWKRAAAYSASLARRPELFYQLISSAKPV
jgi:hypothetical protein